LLLHGEGRQQLWQERQYLGVSGNHLGLSGNHVGIAAVSGFVQRCPLCSCGRRSFYCQRCVILGDFVHSNTKHYERFADKKLRLFSLNRDLDRMRKEVEAKTRDNVEKMKLKEDIKMERARLKYLRHLVKNYQEKNSQNRDNLEKLKNSNLKRTKRLPEFAEKVQKIDSCRRDYCQDMSTNRDQVLRCRDQLSRKRAQFVLSLAEAIFPVVELLPSSGPESVPDAMMDCLADAMRTSYIHGRWVTADQSGELQYQIVAPCLSGNGDYTAVYAWIATNKEGAGGGEPHPAHTISAGLSLATQLLGLVAAVTSTHLPTRLHYFDFGVLETSEYKFSKKVSKLNMNVVNVCLKNGVTPQLVRPCHTLHNIKLLCETLGRRCSAPDEVDSWEEGEEEDRVSDDLIRSWETAIMKEVEELRVSQLQSDDSDEEPDSEQLQEWESVPPDLPDLNCPLTNTASLASASSFVSSTVTSLLWGLTQPPQSPRTRKN